jgi:hypothetical protein
MKSISGFCALLASSLAWSVAPPCNASEPPPPPPPAAYQGLYNKLNGDLGAFNTTLRGLWSGSASPVAFAANLANANANEGPSLLTSTCDASLELQEIQAMGVQAIMVQVGFPVFYPGFYDYLAIQPGYETLTYAQFANCYQQLAQNVKAAGLKLIVENDVVLSNDVAAGWSPVIGRYYATLDWGAYQAARAQNTLNLAQTMQPDYLVVLEEPASESTQSLQPNVNTVSGAASLVNQILTALAPVRSAFKVGAGVDTDQQDFQSFTQSFAGLDCSASQPCVNAPGLDFIDMHIYPIDYLGGNSNFLPNALTMATIAASAGLPVAMTECWMWKMRKSEWNVLPVDTIRARDPFSFWAPLDAYFLQTMENLANYTQMLFMAPEGPYYFWAYQTYDSTTKNWPPSRILTQETTLANQANQVAAYTSTGLSYYNSLVIPPNTTPPSTPVIVQSSSGSPTTASLSWTPSTGKVGVAGYDLWRNGGPLPNAAFTTFQDSGLTGNTTYTYQVEAFDLGGNVSRPATVNITTQGSGPPKPPTNLVAVAGNPVEVTLTWTPPGGGSQWNSYLLFRGTSPTKLAQIQTLSATDTSFSTDGLTAGKTYYYGLEAQANQGLISPMSNIASVTTP